MSYYKKYLDYFVNKTFNKVKWGYFIFFVTSRCNAKCSHCFYWKNLNKSQDLTIEEIEKISSKAGNIQVLLLSGGEPFIRKDLFEIVSIFIKQNKAKVVSIPTNGLLTEKIAKDTERLAKNFPNVTFSINPSIDSLYEKNDKIRGVKGCFKKSIETIKALEKIKLKRKNVEIVINTTISNYNYKEIDRLISFFKQFDITYHNFELLRGNPKEKSLLLPSHEEIKKIHSKAIDAREYYLSRQSSSLLEKISVLGITHYSQKLKEKVLLGKPLPFKCSAGKNIIVLEPNGEIRLCELLPPVGNLKDYDYDLARLLENKKAQDMSEVVKKCRCTHACFLNMSIAKDNKSLIKVPLNYIKWKKK